MSTPSLAERDWSGGVVRYPDPAVEVLDDRFSKYRIGNAVVERLFTGCRWAEGPVWFGDARCLIWSDIPNNRMLRWNEESREVSVYRSPAHHSNGNTRDRQGRLVTCEHTGRRVTRTEHDGSITVLMDRFEGKRLNSPNDVVVHSDGSLFYTRAHTNRWWTFTLELTVLVHGTLVAVMQGNGLWPMFLFGFAGILVVTQMYGLGLSLPVRLLILGVYVGSALFVYDNLGWDRLNEVVRIPLIEYGSMFALAGLFWLGLRTARMVKRLRHA